MPWWQQLGLGYVAATAAFNYMYWLMWRHHMPGGKYHEEAK